ncbi:hypothetical protein AB0E67_29000 [Streptomyces sp. NPDC032161]|uniref:hypothetical protein n=1 Tax=unclassified Streptomyces TaxID=2593676 RepID=UPI0033E9E95F
MSHARPGVLRIGDRVRLAGVRHTVTGLAGTLVHLADENGGASVVSLQDLMLRAEIEPGPAPTVPRLPAARFHGLPRKVVEDAAWRESHIIEILTGLPPDAAPSRGLDAAGLAHSAGHFNDAGFSSPPAVGMEVGGYTSATTM